MSTSPYAPPRAVVVDAPADAGSDAEATRREYIRHEIQLKSVGSLYYFGGVLVLFAGIAMIVALFATRPGNPSTATVGVIVGMVAVYLALGAGSLCVGYGFRRLKPWVRIPGGIMATLGLLGVPIGTLINGWILYLMFGKKGQVVLSEEYQHVIAATPHVKYQRTVGDWIALGILLFLIVGVIAMLVLTRMR